MKKKSVLQSILLFGLCCIGPQLLHSQVFDASTSLKSLSGLTVEKNRMFPVEEANEAAKNDSSFVQPPSKVSLDNPQSYEYRFVPSQIKVLFPEIVYKVDDTEVIDYYSLFPILFEMILTQQNQIEELKIQIEKLNQ